MDEDTGFAGLDEQQCFAVYAASHAFAAAYRPLLEPHGLTYPQFLVLLVLWEEDRRSMRALSKRLHLDSGTLTPLLKRMEAAGLVRRRRSEDDERHLLVDLTDRGHELRPLAGRVREAMICALGGEVEPVLKLRERLVTVTERLRGAPHLRSFDWAEGPEPAGMRRATPVSKP
ncbi:MarR family transcriptional regulator [uncultured Methylobacterium sp.]|uniref:MarR family winged helix-turn-helix transcriptional regulator n=1 Tax=uncultured Methylobacterium sp. TaxID=157278 RepID=UPI002592C6A2|nr:MarR family transcriptional regulator [uncultured Methylobacterium sp.]